MTGSKDSDDDMEEFKLDNEKSNPATKKDSYLNDNYDGFLSAEITDSPPVRLPSMFSASSLNFKLNLNKREKKAEASKARAMSYEVNNNKVVCCCCGKEEFTMLPINDLNEYNNISDLKEHIRNLNVYISCLNEHISDLT